MRPVAGQRQQDDPDAGGADDAAELLGRGQMLGGVQVEGLEHPDPQDRREDDDGDLPRRHGPTGIAEKVGAHQRDHDADGVRGRQPEGDAVVAAERAGTRSPRSARRLLGRGGRAAVTGPVEPRMLGRVGWVFSVAVLVLIRPSALRSAEGHARLPFEWSASWTGTCRHGSSPGIRSLCKAPVTGDGVFWVRSTRRFRARQQHGRPGTGRSGRRASVVDQCDMGDVSLSPAAPVTLSPAQRGAPQPRPEPPPPTKACPRWPMSRCQNRVTPRTGRTLATRKKLVERTSRFK